MGYKKLKKQTKDLVSSSVMLGVGGVTLGALGQGGIAAHTITPAARMMGVGATVGYGMGIMNYVDKQSKKMRKRKWNVKQDQ